MLTVHDLHVSLTEGGKEVLHGLDITVKAGEIHYILGPNGSGKSTFARTLTADPEFAVTKGEIWLEGEKYAPELVKKVFQESGPKDPARISLVALDARQRSLLGIFLAHQTPLAVSGVNFSHFLHLALNARKSKEIPAFEFKQLLSEKAKYINFPEGLLERNLNEGLSGGERKKAEILQMIALEPRYAILDETDSGLDQEAIKDVFTGIQKLKKEIPDLALIVISHYEKVQKFLKPDFVHKMKVGKLY